MAATNRSANAVRSAAPRFLRTPEGGGFRAEVFMTWMYQRSESAAAPGQPSRQARRRTFFTGRGVAWQHPAFGSRWSHVQIVPSRPMYERSSTQEQRSP